MSLLKNWWPFRKKAKKNKYRETWYLSNERVYTPVSQLAIGMYVVELDRPWLESPFLFQGFEIKTQEDIRAVRDVCSYVYIDLTKDRKRRNKDKNKQDSGVLDDSDVDFSAPPPKLSHFEKEIARSESIHHELGHLVTDFMENIPHGGTIDTKAAKEVVAECVNSILHSPDAFLWLSQLKKKDEYTAQHSLNVCVLSIVLGRHINLSVAHLNNVGLCGMMHDMGKMLVPLDILNKPGKLEPEEMEIMRNHTTLGYELLKSSPDMYPGAITTALSHHETLHGQGYPNKISGANIPFFTKIVTIADIYDAITSDRVYQKGRTHLEATNILANMAGKEIDERLVIKFIEAIGVYPPGCVVMMTNGAIAIVVEVNDLSRLRPKIIIILDPDGQPVPEKVINLAELVLDDYGNVLTIKGVVRAHDYGVDILDYYHKGILQKGFANSRPS